jgi:putative membrane protein
MPEPVTDPRVYFAAERTVLAWLRTGIAIMAFGFVVARFGLFVRLLQSQADAAAGDHWLSAYVGVALVGLGILATAGGTIQYQRFCRMLSPAERPTAVRPEFVIGLSWALALIGVLLSVILVI